jgi:hypothetical protein
MAVWGSRRIFLISSESRSVSFSKSGSYKLAEKFSVLGAYIAASSFPLVSGHRIGK